MGEPSESFLGGWGSRHMFEGLWGRVEGPGRQWDPMSSKAGIFPDSIAENPTLFSSENVSIFWQEYFCNTVEKEIPEYSEHSML